MHGKNGHSALGCVLSELHITTSEPNVPLFGYKVSCDRGMPMYGSILSLLLRLFLVLLHQEASITANDLQPQKPLWHEDTRGPRRNYPQNLVLTDAAQRMVHHHVQVPHCMQTLDKDQILCWHTMQGWQCTYSAT